MKIFHLNYKDDKLDTLLQSAKILNMPYTLYIFIVECNFVFYAMIFYFIIWK